MAISEAFDKHPHIAYNDLTHLYWGEYACKVVLNVRKHVREFETYTHAIAARDKMIEEIALPQEGVDYKLRRDGTRAAFFFRNTDDAASFIDENARYIRLVYRPRAAEDIEAMRDRKVRVRKTLFFNEFRWMVSFKNRGWQDNCAIAKECDDWIETYFCISREPTADGKLPTHLQDGTRVLYSYSGTRKVYVNSQADVVAIKIALHDHVNAVECIVLQSEIEPTIEKTPETEAV